MKTIVVAAIALASVIGTPAGAQELFQSKLVVNPSAAQPPINPRAPHSTNPSHDVYDTSGAYLGSDPDGQVRSLIRNNRSDD